MLTETPSGLREIIATFGDPRRADFERSHIVSFTLPYPLLYGSQPVRRGRCHRLLVDNFTAALAGIQTAGLESELKHYSGIYAFRPIRGASSLSTHSWGIAIDAEATKYPLRSLRRFPETIIAIWRQYGFFYGGDFEARKDPMHFQFCTNY